VTYSIEATNRSESTGDEVVVSHSSRIAAPALPAEVPLISLLVAKNKQQAISNLFDMSISHIMRCKRFNPNRSTL
jgi:hypothetical protein